MAKALAVYKVKKVKHCTNQEYLMEGTLDKLVEGYGYTLECGKSYEREKGNAKINRNPKNIKSLIKNLNNAVNNSAVNGYAGETYYLVEDAA